MKTKMKKFPKTQFKLDCGDKPEVRQWLKDNGCFWSNGESLTAEILEARFLVVDTLKYIRRGEHINDFIDNTASVFNPFKKKSKLEKRKLEERIEALEEQIKSSGLLMKTAWDLSPLPSFRCKIVAIKEEPKPVNVGRYKPEADEQYYFIGDNGRMALTGNSGHSIDIHNISTGNCYRTKQEAKQALARQKALVRVNDRIDELNIGVLNEEIASIFIISGMRESGFIFQNELTQGLSTASIFNASTSSLVLDTVIYELDNDIKLAAGWE